MDYMRLTEEYLYNYRHIKVSIVNMQQFIDTELQPRGLSAVRYDKDIVQVSGVESMVERDAIRLADKCAEIKEDIKRNKRIIQSIDQCLNSLPEMLRRIVILKYMGTKKDWYEISQEVGYSVSQCKRFKRCAIYKVAICLYGIDVIKKEGA